MYTEHEDTIAAIATPGGRSALGIIRISGKATREILPQIFFPSKQKEITGFRPILGRIALDAARYVDEAILILFEQPNSYTREDLAEITCHGNPLILQEVLHRIISFGVRLAHPGEFTFRAFLNGRLDLVQAEAVHDLISADSGNQIQLALQQMDGRLSARLGDLRQKMIEIVALMEGNLDFSEEQHYHFIDRTETLSRLKSLIHEIQILLGSFQRGRMIREGIHVVITGKPNVGKSSLFNYLLGEDRAIVTPTAGTTRDYLRERLRLKGHLIHLTDTAGIRTSEEEVEQLGIERSREMIHQADLILFLIDGSQELSAEDTELWELVKSQNSIVIKNKSDLGTFSPHSFNNVPSLNVSVRTEAGLKALLSEVTNRVEAITAQQENETLVANMRHRDLLERAADALEKAAGAVEDGVSEEFALVDIHDAMKHLGAITGEVTIEDIYTHIFSNFCIGK